MTTTTKGPTLGLGLVLRIDMAYRQLKRYREVYEGYRRDNIKPPPEHREQVGSLQEMFTICLIYTLRSIGYKADYYALDLECSVKVGVKLADGCHVTVWDRDTCQYVVAPYTPWDYDGKELAASPVPATYKEGGVLVDSIAEVLEHLHVLATTIGNKVTNLSQGTTNDQLLR